MRTLVVLLLFISGSYAAYPQKNPQWLRYPAISPDGRTIAFTYHGDIYTVPSSGGAARPLIIHDGQDLMPVWSNDGTHIAFASNRSGNFDIYIADLRGGEPLRLTHHSVDEFPYDFSANDSLILFGGARMDDIANRQFPSEALTELYEVPAVSGRIRQLLTTPAENAQMSSDGKLLLYHDRKGRENPWRKHQVSSVARDVWVYDVAHDTHRMLSSFGGEDRNPVFAEKENNIYYLSERDGSFNIYSSSLTDTAHPQQVSFYKNGPVRFLSISKRGTLCYGYDGQVFVKRKNAASSRVAITIRNEEEKDTTITIPVGEVQEMAVSPTGKEVAYIFRGEVFVAGIENRFTRQITHTPAAETRVSFSPDGRKLLYASERAGSWKIVQSFISGHDTFFFNTTDIKEEVLLANDKENLQPSFSPDGTEIAYLEDRTTLRILNIASRNIRTILTGDELYSRKDNDQYFEWSPDGRWLLVQFNEQGAGNDEAGVISTSGKGKLINLTQSGYSDTRPRWMMDGKMITWYSDRQGLHSYANSSTRQNDVFGALVMNEDWENFRERRQRLSLYPSLLADALLSRDGSKLYYLSKVEKNYDLWVTDLVSKNTRMLMALGVEGAEMQWDHDKKYIFLLADGRIIRLDPAANKKIVVDTKADVTINVRQERAAMLEHVWRRTRETFYTGAKLDGNWNALKTTYLKYLDGINNSYDFAEMLNELLGELNVSHTAASFDAPVKNRDVTASLGVFYDQQYTGPGMKILQVMAEGPLDSTAFNIRAGDIINAVDSSLINANDNIEKFLNNKAGRMVRLSITGSSRTKVVAVKAITPGEETELLIKRWVKINAAETDKRSGGQVGYVHLYRMNDEAYRNTYDDVLGKYAGRKAIVLDTRFNRGGDLATELTMFLTGKSVRQNTTGRFLVSVEPGFRWTKPSILLANEANYSDGHCFAYDYTFLGMGKLVGMPVPGSCTWMTGEALQDPALHYSVPTLGVKTMDGRFMENMQTEPDLKVMNDYESVSKGVDRQLEAAVKEMLNELTSKK